MKTIMFTIHDDAVQVFNQPFFARTHSEMGRLMEDVLRDPNSQLARHPKDFHVYEVGSFDSETGIFTPLPHPRCLEPVTNFISRHLPDSTQMDIED